MNTKGDGLMLKECNTCALLSIVFSFHANYFIYLYLLFLRICIVFFFITMNHIRYTKLYPLADFLRLARAFAEDRTRTKNTYTQYLPIME